MPPTIAALAYALIASGIGWGLVLISGRALVEREHIAPLMIGWVGVTVALFLLPTGELFIFSMALLLLALRTSRVPPMILFGFLLCSAPSEGLALRNLPFNVNYLLEISVALLLQLIVVLPSLMSAKARTGERIFNTSAINVLMGLAFTILFFQQWAGANFTSGLRNAVEVSLTWIIPFYAAVALLNTPERLAGFVRVFVASLVIVALIGFCSQMISWNFYEWPQGRLFQSTDLGSGVRFGVIRSGGTLGNVPIAFGTIIAAAVACTLGLRGAFEKRWQFAAVLAALLLGLIGTVSRGPMLGLLLGLLALQLTRPDVVKSVFRFSVIALVVLVPFMTLTETGRQLYANLPFIGDSGGDTVTYREELFEAGMRLFARQPFFGSPFYLEAPELQPLRQGQGIIDMVNSYLFFALRYGGIFTMLLIVAMIGTMIRVYKQARQLDPSDPEQAALRSLGGGAFAALIAIGFSIMTTSFISILPTLLFTFLGLNVAYLQVTAAAVARPKGAPLPASGAEEGTPDEADRIVPTAEEAWSAAPQPSGSFGLQTPWEHLPVIDAPKG